MCSASSKFYIDIQTFKIKYIATLPDTISFHFFSDGSELTDTGLLLFTDDFHASSAFNSAHVASLSESGVSLDTMQREEKNEKSYNNKQIINLLHIN